MRGGVSARLRAVLILGATLALVHGCGSDGGTGPDGEPDYGPCGELSLAVSPVPLADIRYIAPLGNLNPPGHVMPTEHMYFYLRLDEETSRTVVTPLAAVHDLTVTMARATEHVNAGIIDFALTCALCNDVTMVLGHVSSLSDTLFGDTSDLSGWDYDGEYSGGGEIYRGWVRWFNLEVDAGTRLGTAGGNPGQWALDVGLFDFRQTQGTTANPERWRTMSLHAACVIDYYAEGPLRTALAALLDREPLPVDPHPCGIVQQDVPGTAHGAWFLDGAPHPDLGDNHLALVWHNARPSLAAISVGNAVPTLPSNVYTFAPADTGRLHRRFAEVTPDNGLHGYTFPVYDGVVLVEMAAADTLWIEGIAGGSTDPESWAFTAQRSLFAR